MFLVNSRFPLLSATTTSSTRRSPAVAPLLPKLRGHFAEFLNHSSPDRLSILYLTTCVGLRYGPYMHSLEAFLDSIGSPTSPQTGTHHASPMCCTDLPIQRATRLHHNPISGSATLLRHPIACLQQIRSHASQHNTHKVHEASFMAFSITASPFVACIRVREYQPVIHRLRLSASP